MAAYPTANFIRGGNTQLGFVAESAYDDGVTTGDDVAWFQPTSTSFGVVAESETVPDMGLDASGLETISYLAKEFVQGDVTKVMSLDDDGMLLRAAFGSVATTGTMSPYTHTFTLVLDNPASLGGVMIREDTAGTASELEFAGVQCSQFVLEMSPRGQVMTTYSLFGNVDTLWTTASQTRAAPTMAAADIALSKHSAAMSWNSNTYRLTSFRFTVERQVSPDLQYVSEVGIAEAFANANIKSYVEAEMPQSDWHLLSAQIAGTQSDLAIVVTNGSKTATLTLEDAQVMSHEPSGDDIGPRTIRVRWEARAGGTFGTKLALVNTNSAAVITQNTAA